MNRSSTHLRIIALGSIITITLSTGLVLIPQKARAQAAAAGCASLLTARLTGTATGVAAGTAVGTASFATGPGILVHDSANVATQIAVSHGQGQQDLTKCILDSLAWSVAKMTIQSITHSTVNWINSGFQGSPAFISDLRDNLHQLSDVVAENFFQQLNTTTIGATGFNLTSPFQDQITQKLRENYYKETGNLLGLNQYDLSSHSNDPQAFLHGDFNQGGFNAFFSASQNPANNPFGTYMIASNALWGQIGAAAAQRKSELDWGRGFLPWRGNCSNGAASKVSASKTTTVKNTAPGNNGSDTTVIPLGKPNDCIGSPVRTPGSVIESQLENNLGTGIRQLELANSINQIVGALMGQLVNQVLGSGGLSGTSQPASGGGSSYINQATSPSQYSSVSSLADGVTQTISNDLSAVTSYRDNWQKILDASNAAQQACGVRSDISSVITQATTGVSKANAALRQETAVSKTIQDTAASTAVDASSRITGALAQYQSYLGSAVTPSSSDISYAEAQSADTTGIAGATPSLYTQMVNAKNSCGAHT